MAAEEVCEGDGDGVRGSRDNGLRLSLLLVLVGMGMLVPVATALGLLLLLHGLHPRLLLLHGLSFEMLDELGDRHAGLLGVDGELALHGSNLLGRGHPRHLPGMHWLALHGGTVKRASRIGFSRSMRMGVQVQRFTAKTQNLALG